MTTLTAEEFNAGLDAAKSLVLQPGNGVRLYNSSKSQVVSLSAEAGQHRHPWFVSLRWFDSGGWHFNVKPGFVNGIDPIVPGTAPDPTKEQPEPADLGLIEVRWIKASATRSIGFGDEMVPAFFADKDVQSLKQNARLTVENFDSTSAQDLGDSFVGRRKLRAFDIVLAVARAQLVSELQVSDATGATGTIFQYQPRYQTGFVDRVGSRARLAAQQKFQQVQAPTALLRFLNLAEDEPEDRILVATCYLLSPVDFVKDEPDQSWESYVEHKLFWNLAHAARNEVPQVIPRGEQFVTGLAGGLGDLLINQFSALNQALSDNAERMVRRDDVGGKFWSV